MNTKLKTGRHSKNFFSRVSETILLLTMAVSISSQPVDAQVPTDAEFHDSHFHLTNYIQQGISIEDYLAIMGDRVGRSTLFGIPLQQTWSYQNSGDYAPSYYLQSDAPL